MRHFDTPLRSDAAPNPGALRKNARSPVETLASWRVQRIPEERYQMPIAVKVVVSTGVEMVLKVQVPDTPDATAVDVIE